MYTDNFGVPNQTESTFTGTHLQGSEEFAGLGFVGDGNNLSSIEITFNYYRIDRSSGTAIEIDSPPWDNRTNWRVGLFLDEDDYDADRIDSPNPPGGDLLFHLTPPDYYVDFPAPSNADYLTPIATGLAFGEPINVYRAEFNVSHLDWPTIDGQPSVAFVVPRAVAQSDHYYEIMTAFAPSSNTANPLPFRDRWTHLNDSSSVAPYSVWPYALDVISGGVDHFWDVVMQSDYAAARITTVDVNPLPGDYNGDGSVNAADYTVWRDNYGATSGQGLAADGNGDNMVDGDDYAVWREHFGESVSPSTGHLQLTVPEPRAGLMAIIALLGWIRVRR